MAKSKETYNKKEKEKKRFQERQEKLKKMEERKTNTKKGKSLADMMAYVDENGNISDTPPDPSKMRKFIQEDIQIGVPPRIEEEAVIRTGIISYFNTSKGFGFIIDTQSKERIFFHVNNLSEPVQESDKVIFDVEMGPRGLSAVNVKRTA